MPDYSKIALTGLTALSGGLSSRGGTVKPYIPDYLQPVMTDLITRLQGRLSDPATGTEKLMASGKHAINRRFQALPGKVGTQLAQRGFGRSGQLGARLKGVEFERAGQMSEFEGVMAKLIMDRDYQTLSLVERLINAGSGYSYPGNVAGGALSSALQMALQSGLIPGTGGGGGFGDLTAKIGKAASGGGVSGVGANAGIAGAGIAASYPIAKAADWIHGRPSFGEGSQNVQGAPVDWIGPSNVKLYWLQTDSGMKWATAQQYRDATGEWPPSYRP